MSRDFYGSEYKQDAARARATVLFDALAASLQNEFGDEAEYLTVDDFADDAYGGGQRVRLTMRLLAEQADAGAGPDGYQDVLLSRVRFELDIIDHPNRKET